MNLFKMLKDKDEYLNGIKNEWLSSSPLFPEFLSEIPVQIKDQNDAYIKTVSQAFEKQLKRYPRLFFRRSKWKRKTFRMLKDVLSNENILHIHQFMGNKELDNFQEELEEFLRQVRKFAPDFIFSDIGQAIRNYIVYVMFKKIHQEETGFYMPGFGYSMLYPFTDNYIDSNLFSAKEKSAYNQLIRDKIRGKAIYPNSIHQQKTCDLLQAIENEYPRESNPEIFELLLMMLDAQEISIKQQNKDCMLNEEERLDISLYKGGISVFIDRYFVHKEVTENDFIFYLAFGFFLQLADDLQDLKEDSTLHNRNQTIFTVDLHSNHSEMIVNKMFHFVHQLFSNYQAENNKFKDFILSNCYLLLYNSIIGSKEFFSDTYLKKLDHYLPVPIHSLEKSLNNRIENRDSKIQDNYMHILDEMLR